MNIEFRQARDEDHDALRAIWGVAFYGGSGWAADRPLLDDGQTGYVATIDGRVSAGLKVIPLSANRDGATLSCGGLGVVAVAPECRKRGVGQALLTHTLGEMRAAGTHLSSLHPFRARYYRKAGYEHAGLRVRITCSDRQIPRIDGPLAVRRLSADEWPQLAGAYERFAARYNGMCPRTEPRWRRALAPKGVDRLIYAAGDPVEAYAAVSLSDGAWQDETVHELVWATPAGYRSILSVLSALGINKRSLTWCEPIDGPFRAGWFDRGVRFTLARPLMWRVVDVPAALAALAPRAAGGFTIEIDDAQLPANRGPWRVVARDGHVDVARCDAADVRLDVGRFAQALLGEPSFAQLVREGFVHVARDAAADECARVLSAAAVYCLEDF